MWITCSQTSRFLFSLRPHKTVVNREGEGERGKGCGNSEENKTTLNIHQVLAFHLAMQNLRFVTATSGPHTLIRLWFQREVLRVYVFVPFCETKVTKRVAHAGITPVSHLYSCYAIRIRDNEEPSTFVNATCGQSWLGNARNSRRQSATASSTKIRFCLIYCSYQWSVASSDHSGHSNLLQYPRNVVCK